MTFLLYDNSEYSGNWNLENVSFPLIIKCSQTNELKLMKTKMFKNIINYIATNALVSVSTLKFN